VTAGAEDTSNGLSGPDGVLGEQWIHSSRGARLMFGKKLVIAGADGTPHATRSWWTSRGQFRRAQFMLTSR
jgi:hypothetical protein